MFLKKSQYRSCRVLSILLLCVLGMPSYAADFSVETRTIGSFNMRVLADIPKELAFDYFLIGHGDLNGDQNDDLVYSVPVRDPRGRHSPDQFSKPVILFWNSDSKTYKAEDSVQKNLPQVHYAHRTAIMPSASGGTLLFIADTGLDGTHAANCGGYNKLLHFNGKSVVDISSELPQILDYSHGLASADVNNDGWIDIAVINSPYTGAPECGAREHTNENYLLMRVPNTDRFEKAELELSGSKNFYTAGFFVEQPNSEGKKEFLYFLGGKGDGAKGVDVFLQADDGSFELVEKVPAPKVANASVANFAQFTDSDSSSTSVIVSYAAVSDENGWHNRAVRRIGFKGSQVLELPNNFEKVDNSIKENVWCMHLDVGDIIGDAEKEIVCTNNWGMDIEGVASVYYKSDDNWKMLDIEDLKKVCGFTPKWFQFLYSSIVTLEGEDHLVGFWLVDPYTEWDGYQTWDNIELQYIKKVSDC